MAVTKNNSASAKTINATEPKTEPKTEASTDALTIFGSSTIKQFDPNIPEYLRDQVGNQAGSEDVGRDDVLIPRLALAQDGMSPQLKKAHESYIPGLQAGDLFNSVTGEIYGAKVQVVPLVFFKNFIEFVPISAGGGVKQMYNSMEEVPPEKLQFTRNEKNESVSPDVTEFKNRLSLLLHADGRQPELIVVSFKASGLKAAKKWNSLIKATNLPAFARSYILSVVNKVKGQQTWFGLDVMPDVFVPAYFFAQAKAHFDNLGRGGYKVDTTGLESDANESGAGGDTGF